MLIQFSISNYRSIKEEQVFTMVKGSSDELESTNSFKLDNSNGESLLRSSAIYGANAAGKSNVILAMMDMEHFVRNSASTQEGDIIDIDPFLFDDETSIQPSEFEIVFVNEGIKYQYGFAAKKSHIVEEWLFAYPKGRPQRWFHRVYNDEKATSEYKFSESFTGKKSTWQSMTRNNALFLSTAIQLNSDQLKPVFNWFKFKLRPTRIDGFGTEYTASICQNEDKKNRVLAFLHAADFNIHDIKVKKEKLSLESLPSEMPSAVKESILEDLKDRKFLDIKSVHKTNSGRSVELDFNEESDGTQKFFSFAGPWINSLEEGYILVIDELHNNLHPKMVKYLIELFHNSETNPNNAQLIFTTHETSILDMDVFRKDQIWFCEKDESQATSLFSLSDFSVRKNRDNIRQNYLSGKYGALPFTANSIFNEAL